MSSFGILALIFPSEIYGPNRPFFCSRGSPVLMSSPISLLVGFYLNENSTGGAIKDYFNHKGISINFSKLITVSLTD